MGIRLISRRIACGAGVRRLTLFRERVFGLRRLGAQENRGIKAAPAVRPNGWRIIERRRSRFARRGRRVAIGSLGRSVANDEA